ncbi:MAG: hypothetical protein H0V05_12085 [Euzebyaceae bacterium]|nr:hypothetical protein [Euzebyaceae bacterium]
MTAPPSAGEESRPPIDRVPIIVPCPCCRRLVRATVSWRERRPRTRRRCPWCARLVVLRPGPDR